ncbi:MAG: DUF5131 family protein [Christensenellaceae bacterium]|jgi:protein gp37
MITNMARWNLWHGCKKVSAGCKNCYVYRMDAAFGKNAAEVYKTNDFALPLQQKKDGSYKIESGSKVYTCFTSDFFLAEADEWRGEAWEMMKARQDLFFEIITKRPERIPSTLPVDWGASYKHISIACTIENQEIADKRLPIYLKTPIYHKSIVCEPLLEEIDLSKYLSTEIEQITVGGESGKYARVCDFEWVLSLQGQAEENNISFYYHQTGAKSRKNGRIYSIPRNLQGAQAKKANISQYRCIDKDF